MSLFPDSDQLQDIERFFQKGQEWLKEQHRGGMGGADFCRSRSEFMDILLRRLWKTVSGFPEGRDSSFRICLAAMGGYGREELNPFSDIDLLFLHFPGEGKDLTRWIQALLHPLWDWGLTVGYTVQTLKHSWRIAQKDFDVFLAFLDARWLAGDKEIFLQWAQGISQRLKTGQERELILQIMKKDEARHKKLGDSVYVLEPEIKEGKGGLRDYHSALWAAKIKYRIRSAQELTEHGLLSEGEGKNYFQALGFLWRTRNQLHYLHGRREDRLSFEDQEALAGMLGYQGEDSIKATESFLRDYFDQTIKIYRLSGNLLDKCLNDVPAFSSARTLASPPEIAPGFYLYHGRLALTDPSRIDRDPFQLWRIFEIIHRHGLEISTSLKEVISQHLDLVSERFRASSESIDSFRSFFEETGHLFRVLEAMHETGFLRRFLPEFERVHCHVQYDRYHLYPVDVHSLYVVRELEELERNKKEQSFPLLEKVMGEIADPGLLKFCALIHDLGKAEGSSHTVRGERIAETIGNRLGLSSEKGALLRFLVREHLTFLETAQRRDLNDENLLLRFAQAVGDRERLKMLYLLSFADLRAVGPSAWTAWKDALMRELFIKTLHLLEKGEGLKREDQERVVQIQSEVLELLQGQISPPKIAEYLVHIPSRHYQSHDARSIGQQILMAERIPEQTVIVDGEEKPEEGCDEITVVAKDEPGLFAKISGVLTARS